ncbi:MAG: AMP-binding protein [Lachnospiraceae bacterium]|nr:AMP-binding protein [Lachnospiraceae bacterium]
MFKEKLKSVKDEYVTKGYWQKKTYGELIHEWADKYRDRIAVVEGSEKITYKELDVLSEKLACFFIKKGIKKGDSVIFQLTNMISLPIAYFALFKIGAVPIPVYPALREREITALAVCANATAYICVEEYLNFCYKELVNKVFEETESMNIVIYEKEIRDYCFSERGEYKCEYEKPEFDEVALLLLSGGSTGIPKLIERTHADHFYSVRLTSEICRLNESSVYLGAMPLTHNFFLCGPGLLGTLYSGGKVVMAEAASPDEILRLIDEEGVTITSLVPAVAKICLEMQPYFEEYSSETLKIVQLGGAIVEDSLAQRVEEVFGCKVQQIYGMSEGIICCTRLDDSDDVVYGTQGKEISEADVVKIVDAYGMEVPDGENGELIAKGPYTVDHYYKNVHSEKFTEDGFYKTGDKAVRRKDGNIVILGRADELINKGGEKVMPVEIEELLKDFEDIKDAIVIGNDDEALGMEICAFIISSNPCLTDAAIIEKLKQEKVAEYKIPDLFIRVEQQWPLTAVGKIDKKELIKML